MTGVKYRQQTIDQLGKTLARIKATITSDQTQITTWTSTVNGAISQQKALTAQLKGAITTAKNARKLVCKKGL
jgi:ABC-type transporter Mla subunit MlaD